METKFTRGEWTLRKNLDKPENWDVIAPNVSYICELGANWEGNGPLIAAAPELYFALKHIVDDVELGYNIQEAIKLYAIPALAKARGENTNQFTHERQGRDEEV